MTTVSEEVQNGVGRNTDKEDVHCYIHNESDEYPQASRQKHVQKGQAVEIPLHTASSNENVSNTNLVAYMTTVSEEFRNGVDINTGKEDMYHDIPNDSDEYSYAYMHINGQKRTQKASETNPSGKIHGPDKQTGNQASGESEQGENESGDGQNADTSLKLEEIGKGNHEGVPHIHAQRKQGSHSSKQEKEFEIKETKDDALNQFYINNKVVENMKRMKRL